MEDGKVTFFRWKDYAHGGKQRKMTLAAEEFIRRFLLHILPKGLVCIRYYGGMANLCRGERITHCRALLAAESPQQTTPAPKRDAPVRRCPLCGGNIEVIEMIVPATYHAAGPADGVKRILLSASTLLAGHTGRGARMSEVCPHGMEGRFRGWREPNENRPGMSVRGGNNRSLVMAQRLYRG
jgi:hypothetical protein